MPLLVLMAALAAAAGPAPSRPDLTIEKLSDPPALAKPGDRFTVHDVTVNQGRRRGAASETGYRLGRKWLGSRFVPALHKDERSDGVLELKIPRRTPDGTYVLTA